MTDKKYEKEMVLGEGRVSFPSMFKPVYFDRTKNKFVAADQAPPGAKLEYRFEFIVSMSEAKRFAETATALGTAKWGGMSGVTMPLRSGSKVNAELEASKKAKQPYYEGMGIIRSSGKFPFKVVGPTRKPILDEAEIFPGSYGYAAVKLVAVETPNGKFIKAYPVMYMKSRPTKEEDRIGGRSAEDVFSNVHGKETDEEIPF